jgi:hypothetical protein
MYSPNKPTPLQQLLSAGELLRKAIGHNTDCRRVQSNCPCTCQASIMQGAAIAAYDRAHEEFLREPQQGDQAPEGKA